MSSQATPAPDEPLEDRLDRETKSWHIDAKREWSSLMGVELAPRQPTFKWMPSPGPLTVKQCGATAASLAWRIMANRVDECARLLQQCAAPQAETRTSALGVVIRQVSKLRHDLATFPASESEAKSQGAAWLTAAADTIGRAVDALQLPAGFG